MELVSVEIENFMSFVAADRTFGAGGLVLVEGRNLDEGDSNGAGKSTLWDAVSWCLFGQTVRGLKNDEVVNRKVGEGTHVRVRLRTVKGDCSVRRFRKHADFKDRLLVNVVDEVSKGVKTVELGSVAATQEWLLKELGIDFELFRCTVLFAQGETFNFVDETDKQQKEILSKVKRLNFETALKRVREAVAANRSQRGDIERKLAVLKSHADEGAIESLRDEARAWDEANAAKIASATVEIEAAEREEAEHRAKLVEASFAEVKGKLKERIVTLEAARREDETKLVTVRSMKAQAQTRAKTLGSLGDTCSACEQPVANVEVAVKLSELDAQLARLQSAETSLVGRIKQTASRLGDCRDKLEALAEKEALQRVCADRAATAAREVKRLEKHREALRGEVNPWRAKVEEAVAKQERIRAKIRELAAEVENLDEILPYYQFWETAFSDKGIKSFVFDGLCATLTMRANSYLNLLSGGSIAVTFDTQTKLKSGELREKFECAVITDGVAVPYAAYSGGEKTRIRLAVDMALADLMADSYGSKFNLIVFDEQDTWLDAQGRECYLRLLKERAKSQRVFVVSHDSELKSKFDETWVVEKKNGVSRFVEAA